MDDGCGPRNLACQVYRPRTSVFVASGALRSGLPALAEGWPVENAKAHAPNRSLDSAAAALVLGPVGDGVHVRAESAYALVIFNRVQNDSVKFLAGEIH